MFNSSAISSTFLSKCIQISFLSHLSSAVTQTQTSVLAYQKSGNGTQLLSLLEFTPCSDQNPPHPSIIIGLYLLSHTSHCLPLSTLAPDLFCPVSSRTLLSPSTCHMPLLLSLEHTKPTPIQRLRMPAFHCLKGLSHQSCVHMCHFVILLCRSHIPDRSP